MKTRPFLQGGKAPSFSFSLIFHQERLVVITTSFFFCGKISAEGPVHGVSSAFLLAGDARASFPFSPSGK